MDFESKGKGKKQRKTIEFEGMRRPRAAQEYKKSHIQILPRETVMDILSRLSIYSLFQCTLVSKEWRDIIARDSHFAAMQHNRALENKNNILSLLLCSDDLQTLQLVEKGGLKHRKPTVMNAILKYPYIDYHHVGTCNGLLGFFRESISRQTQIIYVCNPITRERVCLPELTILNVKASGFGFDYETNKYKVVQVFLDCAGVLVAKMHTLGTEAWRQMENVPSAFDAFSFQVSDILVNGSLHWCCHKYVRNTILSLDMSKEQFGTMPAPELEGHRPLRMEIMAWKGHLSVVRLMALDFIQIWVMKEYNVESSWTQLFRLRCPERLERCFKHIFSRPFDDESALDARVVDLLIKILGSEAPYPPDRKVFPHIGSLVSLKTITAGKVINRMEFSRSSKGSSF